MKKIELVYVAGYTRISTDEEHQRYSLSAQEDAIRNWVKSHRKEGYHLFRIYSDQKSAASLDRPGLQNFLEDAERGLFQMVIVVKLDRLCRSLADQLYLTEQFRKWGIRLEGVDESIDVETPDGITWTQVMGAFNEAERRKISYRTRKGMRKKASLGGWCGGYTPLGYSYGNHTKIPIPDIDERRLIEKIFNLYVVKRMEQKALQCI